MDESHAPTAAQNIASLLNERAEQSPDAPAFVRLDVTGATSSTISNHRLHQAVAAAAGGLRSHGVARGSRVIVSLSLSVEFHVALLAVLRLGAVAVVVDPAMGTRALERAARPRGADALICTPTAAALRYASQALRDIPTVFVAGRRRFPGTERCNDVLHAPRATWVESAVPVGSADVALETFHITSTSVERITRTHQQLRAQHEVLSALMPQLEGARVWTDLPVIAMHALARDSQVLAAPPTSRRTSLVVPKLLHGLIARARPDVLIGTPTLIRRLTLSPGRGALESVTSVTVLGGPVTPKLARDAQAMFPRASIQLLYGPSEAETVAAATASEVDRHADALRDAGGVYVGHEIDDVDIALVRPASGAITIEPGATLNDWRVTDGTPGEVIVRGRHITGAADGDSTIVDEHDAVWLRTGDIVRRDADGGLWLLGRRGHDVRIRGRRVWPLEIETTVANLVEVERAAICRPRFTGADRAFKNAVAVLAVQPSRGFDRRDAVSATIRDLARRGLDTAVEVRSLSKLPVDQRFGMRVDLTALQERLKPENQEDY